jgi:hypothetical protein
MRYRIFVGLHICICMLGIVLEGHRSSLHATPMGYASINSRDDSRLTVEQLQMQVTSLERRVAELERITAPRIELLK